MSYHEIRLAQNTISNKNKGQFFQIADNCHCEECNDEAISLLI